MTAASASEQDEHGPWFSDGTDFLLPLACPGNCPQLLFTRPTQAFLSEVSVPVPMVARSFTALHGNTKRRQRILMGSRPSPVPQCSQPFSFNRTHVVSWGSSLLGV